MPVVQSVNNGNANFAKILAQGPNGPNLDVTPEGSLAIDTQGNILVAVYASDPTTVLGRGQLGGTGDVLLKYSNNGNFKSSTFVTDTWVTSGVGADLTNNDPVVFGLTAIDKFSP